MYNVGVVSKLNYLEIIMKKVNVEKLVEIFNGGVSVEDFNKGNGVYSVWLGSRGLVEGVLFIGESYSVRSKEELINELCEDYNDDEEEMREYLDEFCDSGEIDYYEDVEGLYEILGEEESFEYFDVVVN